MADKKNEDKEGDPLKSGKSTMSLSKKKFASKSAVASRYSLKKGVESLMSTVSSTGSLVTKRQSEFEKLAKGPRYQNTYRLDPKRPFKSHEVYRVLEMIVTREVVDYPHYDPLGASRMIQTIAGEVRSAVRLLNYDRYKICVLVLLGEKKLQGLQSAFRALWDHERDGWATYFHQTRTYFLSCSCYGIYHD